jgi:hypothetical protein
MRFGPDAQELFFEYLGELERKLRANSGLAAPMVAHLAKYRSLMPSLAGLFELADSAAAGADLNVEVRIGLDHARQAAAFCEYLESHARRAYSCVTSPELHAARELARHITSRDLPDDFTTRDVYIKGWSGLDTPERVRDAVHSLEDANWIRRKAVPERPGGGRPSEVWVLSPRVVHP